MRTARSRRGGDPRRGSCRAAPALGEAGRPNGRRATSCTGARSRDRGEGTCDLKGSTINRFVAPGEAVRAEERSRTSTGCGRADATADPRARASLLEQLHADSVLLASLMDYSLLRLGERTQKGTLQWGHWVSAPLGPRPWGGRRIIGCWARAGREHYFMGIIDCLSRGHGRWQNALQRRCYSRAKPVEAERAGLVRETDGLSGEVREVLGSASRPKASTSWTAGRRSSTSTMRCLALEEPIRGFVKFFARKDTQHPPSNAQQQAHEGGGGEVANSAGVRVLVRISKENNFLPCLVSRVFLPA